MENIPESIELDRGRRILRVAFADATFELPCAYLRLHSPSAEVRGHGPGEPKLLSGKAGVNITDIRPVGSYAVCLVFDDGHDSGLYSWQTLYDLGVNMSANMRRYRERLREAGMDDNEYARLENP